MGQRDKTGFCCAIARKRWEGMDKSEYLGCRIARSLDIYQGEWEERGRAARIPHIFFLSYTRNTHIHTYTQYTHVHRYTHTHRGLVEGKCLLQTLWVEAPVAHLSVHVQSPVGITDLDWRWRRGYPGEMTHEHTLILPDSPRETAEETRKLNKANQC